MATATKTTTEIPDIAQKVREQLLSAVQQGQKLSIDAARAGSRPFRCFPPRTCPPSPGSPPFPAWKPRPRSLSISPLTCSTPSATSLCS